MTDPYRKLKYPCVVETRLTYDHGGTTGIHTSYPLGFFNNVQLEGQQVTIESGNGNGLWPITIALEEHHGWATVRNGAGEPMTKFLPPEGVEPGYREYHFFHLGKFYILEFRFHHLLP